MRIKVKIDGGRSSVRAVRISTWVAYDEKQLRRTIKFILRPQLRLVRIAGVTLILLGGLLIALDPASVVGYAVVLLGILFIVVVPPMTVASAVRMQSNVLKEGSHLTLDDEAVTVTFPLVESRLKWAGLGRVVETPEMWYIMFGKAQAVPIPKAALTEPQRAEFAAFVRTAVSNYGQ